MVLVVGVVVVAPPVVVVVRADVVDVLVPWVVLVVVLEPDVVVVTFGHGVEPDGPTRLAMQVTNAPVAESIVAVSPVVRQSAFASARAKPYVSAATQVLAADDAGPHASRGVYDAPE